MMALINIPYHGIIHSAPIDVKILTHTYTDRHYRQLQKHQIVSTHSGQFEGGALILIKLSPRQPVDHMTEKAPQGGNLALREKQSLFSKILSLIIKRKGSNEVLPSVLHRDLFLI